jgi:hypothetical protein
MNLKLPAMIRQENSKYTNFGTREKPLTSVKALLGGRFTLNII